MGPFFATPAATALSLDAVCLVARSNGAIIPFGGVASLCGSRACGSRPALTWAPVTKVLLSRVITLPCGAVLASLAYWIGSRFW
ncbi:MAG TPA: hypothetical protein DCM86_05630 [Verrucomicrobiales bacterium]|nr:hypothetical protein [Verrucomicrobiales bacterium]